MLSTLGKVTALCCTLFVLVSVVGCGQVSPEVTAMTKVATGQIDKLTGTEIQALVDKFVPGVTLTDDQATLISEILAEAQIKTLNDFIPVVKVATGQMDTLSPAEVQTLAAKFAPDVTLTDQQATEIVNFLATNNVKTVDDLQQAD